MFGISFTDNRWLFSIANAYRGKMMLYFFLEILNIISTLFFVFFSKNSIDIALGVKEGSLQWNLCYVVGLILLGIVFRTSSQWVNQKTQIRMLQDVQYKILQRQMLSSWRVIKRWDTGDILVRLNTDCVEIVQMLSSTWIAFVITVIKLLASFIFLFTLDKSLAIIILCITPLFFLSKIYFRKMKKLNEDVKASESELGVVMQENLRYRTVLRSLGILAKRLRKVIEKQNTFSSLKLAHLRFSLLSQTAMRTAMSVGYVVAFVWGVYRLQQGVITYGTMTAFLQLVNQVQSPILTLGAFVPAFIRFKVAIQRVKDLDNVEFQRERKGVEFGQIDYVSFEEVSFSYGEERIIDDFNARFELGDKVAITGASGKGKTTLIRLMLGMLKPNQGSVKISGDGTVSELAIEHIENFSYVPQGNTLLKGTVRENIVATNEMVSEERIREVLHYACAEFVYDLPEGLETYVGESGLGLSEGQAQRIAIARAILRDKKIWLFDEATSALDAETTDLFLERINPLLEKKIAIFVTHDKKVTLFCNKHIMLN